MSVCAGIDFGCAVGHPLKQSEGSRTALSSSRGCCFNTLAAKTNGMGTEQGHLKHAVLMFRQFSALSPKI